MTSANERSVSAPRRRAIARVAGLALAAAVLYGGWAVLANSSHGWTLALRAGLVQGASSATTTLVISSLIETLFVALARSPARTAIAGALPPTCSAGVHAVAHVLAGTPEILRTIAPSVVLGYVFAAIYAAGLARTTAPAPPSPDVGR
jgi:hypothetical protein